MSEIDKPEQQPTPTGGEPSEGASTSPQPASAYPPPAPAASDPTASPSPTAGGQQPFGAGTPPGAIQPPPFGGAQPGQHPYGQPVYPQPSGQPSYAQPSYAQPSYAQPPYGQPPYGQPSYGTANAPTSGPAAPGDPTTAQYAPVSGPAAPGQYPHWTPPSSTPKKMPTAAKVVIGGVAAVALALCSGVTGAVVATSLNDGGFELPVSQNAAPVVDRSTLSGVARDTQPSVVSIATGSGEGSGVIISNDGYIVTNNHVVESAQGGSVTITLSDGKKVKAKVIGTDPRTDLGVAKADAGTDLKPAKFADSDRVAVGDTVLAIGSPLGLQGSVTSGIISAKDRTIRAGQTSSSLSGLLQTDAPINPGNSGGALVNTNGEVIGINTAIATSGQGEGNIGVGFAIPSNKAKQVAEQLINGQKVSHPYLGVSVDPADDGGARIASIAPNSPAAGAGLKEGDVITKFGDRVVHDSDDLVSAVQSGKVGQKVTVEFHRNGQQMTATVTLGEAS
ncbi:MAG TPA: trypsin-like peptidase domain-containing protein [Candidatus Limnocylindrales bacterium]|nr:trypsin-like peptidase domain-containing protein [Candidatus Limnocylindrales bacterium]